MKTGSKAQDPAPPEEPRTSNHEVRLVGLGKRYDHTVALSNVSVTFASGKIHAVCGQNGSGKSTLVKILTGVATADTGTLTLWGDDVDPRSTGSARPGIAVIHQDLAVVDGLSAVENFGVTGRYGARRGLISWRAERTAFRTYARRLGVVVDPDAEVGALKPAERAFVAIMRSLRQLDDEAAAGDGSKRLLVLDEPTVYFSVREKKLLAQSLRRLAATGVGIVLISHDLDYVHSLSDVTTVLRDGRFVTTVDSKSADKATIVRHMLGRSLHQLYPEVTEPVGDEILLSAEGVSGGRVRGLDLVLRAGEIVGLAGLPGAGHEDVPYLLVGDLKITAGTLRAHSIHRSTHRTGGADGLTDRRRHMRMGIVPANRSAQSVWMEGTVRENLTIADLSRVTERGRLAARREDKLVTDAIDDFRIKTGGGDTLLAHLSGGNQQKVVIGRWLSTDARIHVLHEPVQGVDIAANADLFGIIARAAAGGAGVVICSNEWEHLAHMCHRVLVFRDGDVVFELSGDRLTEDSLAMVCQGVHVNGTAIDPEAVTADLQGRQERRVP